MISWDDAQTIAYKMAGNETNTESQTFIKLMMNIGYKDVLMQLGRPVTEKTKTSFTVNGQQGYQMPNDYNWLKSISVTVGTIKYTPQEVESQEQWDRLNMTPQSGSVPQYYFARPRFGVQGNEIQLYPTPSSSTSQITIVYEATDRNLAATAYSTGTISISSNGQTVTGAGTTFTTAMVNRYFQVTGENGDGLWYRVSSFNSATSLTIEQLYSGSTVAGASYTIAEIFALPEDIQMLPIYFALQAYFAFRKDEGQERKYLILWTNGMKEARKRFGTKTRNNLIRDKHGSSSASYPSFFPGSISA